MRTVKFEKRNKQVQSVKGTIEYIAKTAPTKEVAVGRLSDILSGVKLGFGASHVWCSTITNERIFVIEGY